jgi:hypothetical protein
MGDRAQSSSCPGFPARERNFKLSDSPSQQPQARWLALAAAGWHARYLGFRLKVLCASFKLLNLKLPAWHVRRGGARAAAVWMLGATNKFKLKLGLGPSARRLGAGPPFFLVARAQRFPAPGCPSDMQVIALVARGRAPTRAAAARARGRARASTATGSGPRADPSESACSETATECHRDCDGGRGAQCPPAARAPAPSYQATPGPASGSAPWQRGSPEGRPLTGRLASDPGDSAGLGLGRPALPVRATASGSVCQ